MRIGLYTKDGERIAHVILRPGDLVLLCEGHSLEFLDQDTNVIELDVTRAGGVFCGRVIAAVGIVLTDFTS